jgi:hypothetical protein
MLGLCKQPLRAKKWKPGAKHSYSIFLYLWTQSDIFLSFSLENNKYQEYKSLGGQLSRLFHRKDEKKEGDYKDLGPGTVQLWSEIVEEEEEVCQLTNCEI